MRRAATASVLLEGRRRLDRTLRRVRRVDPHSAYGIDFEPLSLVTADGLRLAAWWVPGGSGRTAVVLHHHFGGQKATTLPWLRLLHRLGIAALPLDGRDHAASDAAPNGRRGFHHRALDVLAGFAEARRRGAERVFLLGQSQGGAAVVIAAAAEARAAGVILESGPATDLLSASWGLAGVLLGERRADTVGRARFTAHLVRAGGPARYLGALWPSLFELRHRPLVWIHGSADLVIPRRNAAVWFHTAGAGAAAWRSVVIPGGRHVTSVSQDPARVRAAVEPLLA